jgi:hypothetical protein
LFDEHLLESDQLLICRPVGTLNFDLALQIIEGIEERESESDVWFDRFADVTQLDGISLSLNDVKEIAQRRREYNPNKGSVKAAFLAKGALAFATARIYEMFLRSDRIEVRVFSRLEDAAEWLEIDAEKLLPVPA